jgi:hypothetical protein
MLRCDKVIKCSFQDPKSFKDLASYLISELNKLDSSDYSNELNDWANTSYTTSSEYLGELRIILNKVLNDSNVILPIEVKSGIELAISAINKAFGA